MSRPKLYSVAEVAEELNLTKPQVWGLLRNGQLPKVKLGDHSNSAVRVPVEAVDAYLAARTRPATTGPLAQHH